MNKVYVYGLHCGETNISELTKNAPEISYDFSGVFFCLFSVFINLTHTITIYTSNRYRMDIYRISIYEWNHIYTLYYA